MQHYIAGHFTLLLKASGQAAILIILVLGLQWAFARQLKPRWRYALWLLVMVRLALPWTISSSASVFNLFNFSHAAPWKFDFSRHFDVRHATAAAAQPGVEAATHEPATTVQPMDWVARCLLGIWATGALALAIWLLVTHFRLSRRISRRRPLIDAPVLSLLEDCKQQMGIRTPVTVVETPEVGSPGLFGFIRPRLLLPAGLTRDFSPGELRYVFLHELAHIKRNDIIAGWLMTALQILHWFNPFVWVAGYRMRVDRELACDALALSYARDEENQSYGQTIIKLLENFGRSAWGPSMAGAVENINQLKERIRMIAKYKKANRGFIWAVAIFAGLGLITLTDAKSSGSDLAKDIVGTWVMVGTPDAVGDPPATGARYKVITDKTFSVTEADPQTGVVLYRHGGPYTLKGDKYSEHIDHAEGSTSNLLKQTFIFKIKVEGDTYTQTGVGNDFNEVWKRVKSETSKPQKSSPTALAGTWRDATDGVSIVIHDSTLEFREADTNHWLKASFSVFDTKPKQIVAVITECVNSDAVGLPAFGIYELKDGTLTMSGYSPGSPFVPPNLDAGGARKIVFKKQ